ncbi:hypothetical protein [Actinomadura sp. DC4]|uniref:hypothetical protein n=1 Tax=Actinomadura sp. DC4 TaxID=3055069 RepID=UPI0025AF43F5|nr:hypothetical protein [Actinomadura sp. DC4]MDN3355129.1 hypothetical protein [Actinomadura sp. DC4]
MGAFDGVGGSPDRAGDGAMENGPGPDGLPAGRLPPASGLAELFAEDENVSRGQGDGVSAEDDAAPAGVPASFGVRVVFPLESAGTHERHTGQGAAGSPEELTWSNTPRLRELLLEARELGVLGLGRSPHEVIVENMWTGRARALGWETPSWSLIEDRGLRAYEGVRDVVAAEPTGDGMALLWSRLQPDSDDATYVHRFGHVLAGLHDGDALSPLVDLAVQGAATGAGVPVPGAALFGRIVGQLLWHRGDREAITRRRLAEAVSAADVLLCAHHGALRGCPGLWSLARSRTDRQLGALLQRYGP